MGLNAALREKLAKASATAGGTYIKHGRYLFIVDRFQLKLDGFKGISAIVEFLVAQSAPAADGKEGPDGPPNAVGSRCSFVCNLTGGNAKAAEASAGNLKAFVMAFFGQDEYAKAMADAEFGKDESERYGKLIEELLPLTARGYFIANETYLSKAQSGQFAGKDMVRSKWSHVETTDEQQAANILILDGKVPLSGAATSSATSTPATA